MFDGQGNKLIRKMNDQIFEIHRNQNVTFQQITFSGGNLTNATTSSSVNIEGGTVILDGGFKYTEFEYSYETAFVIRSEENVEGVLRVKKDIDFSGNSYNASSVCLASVNAGKVILEDVETNGTLYFSTRIPEAFVMTSPLACYMNIKVNTINPPYDPGEIKDGDTIDGMNDEGKMTPEVQWICRYEDSLIEPLRPVLDIDTGKYAAGDRN